VILERDETGMIVAECPAIPGCVSQGTTEDEAIANVREAIVGCLEVRIAQGLRVVVPAWAGAITNANCFT
jgi:predicted RNase H-like HicB family nuclease